MIWWFFVCLLMFVYVVVCVCVCLNADYYLERAIKIHNSYLILVCGFLWPFNQGFGVSWNICNFRIFIFRQDFSFFYNVYKYLDYTNVYPLCFFSLYSWLNFCNYLWYSMLSTYIVLHSYVVFMFSTLKKMNSMFYKNLLHYNNKPS